MPRLAPLALLLCVLPASAQDRTAEEIYQDLRETYPHNVPVDPAVELAEFTTHPDLEVSLFAAEPWVVNPIGMTWDPQGRLWVINGPSYPQILPGQRQIDFISCLEDTDGDGTADKCTVFYEGLYVPTGLEYGDGGVYVANQPDLLFLKDADGDNKADEKTVLLSGFGTEDNHHAISAFVWGPDGKLYFQSGVFLHTQVETPSGLLRLDGEGGVFELRPRTLDLAMYNVGTATNPWGHTFDEWGQNFLTEGPQGGIWYLEPAALASLPRERVPGTSAPKACGNRFIYNPAWGDEWQGKMILNAFKNKTVNAYSFSDDGAGYSTREDQPLMLVNEGPNFRPVAVEFGPDGAAYIADFYQPVIGHMQYEFRDERRDHIHGRVWRLAPKNRPALENPKLGEKTAAELAANLSNPDGQLREKSRRMLYELSADDAPAVVAALDAALANVPADDPRAEHHKLEILWAFQTIAEPNLPLLNELLASPEPRARAAAVRVMRDWLGEYSGDEAFALLETAAADDYPRVRLESLLALSRLPGPRNMQIGSVVADRPMDRTLQYTFKHFALGTQETWLPQLQAGTLDLGSPARIEAALSAVNAGGAVPRLFDLLAAGQIPADRRPGVLNQIASLGDADSLGRLFDPGSFTSLLTNDDGRVFTDWRIAGPFPYDEALNLPSQKFGPEAGPFDADGAFENARGGDTVGWKDLKADRPEFTNYFTGDNDYSIAYARTAFDGKAGEKVALIVAADDAVQVWLNGESLYDTPSRTAMNAAGVTLTGTLRDGENVLLLKVANATGDWTASARTLGTPGEYDPALHAGVLDALAATGRKRGGGPELDAAPGFRALFTQTDPALKAAALRLAGAWRREGVRPELEAAAADDAAPVGVRVAAVEALAELGGTGSAAELKTLSSNYEPLAVRYAAVKGLAALDLQSAARRAADLMTEPPAPGDDAAPAELAAALLAREGGGALFAEALRAKGDVGDGDAVSGVNVDAAKLALRGLASSGARAPELIDVLRTVAGTGKLSETLAQVPVPELAAAAENDGDPARGQAIFRRKALACYSCHAIGGGGADVGPGLDGIGASSPTDYLVESLLYPSKAVREGYAGYQVLTLDGKVITGVLRAKTDDAVTLVDSTTREPVEIAADDVLDMAPTGSIMPTGLIDDLTREEFTDLVAFLHELGRPGEYRAVNVPLVRTWRVAENVPAELLAEQADRFGLGMLSADGSVRWRTAYGTVDGTLPAEEFAPAAGTFAVLKTTIDVGTPGELELKIADPAGVDLYVDGTWVRDVTGATRFAVDEPGLHTLLFRVDVTRRPGGLNVLLDEAGGSAARAQVVNGP